eukprot:gnl/TRDRNA2_/TRDRNA2_178394_c0_seq1.p1 gnl/TRDRNA2_/TRDRNA2_178394_c0~~gnl/TRDRNA2_/TRDRNA2_178394_c0_seq1.p1  ORF type:complete len:270 (-),score=63.53 gnl/TRDRNA2_/TRDRNA2_178394_c0_seq1:237-1046(-)
MQAKLYRLALHLSVVLLACSIDVEKCAECELHDAEVVGGSLHLLQTKMTVVGGKHASDEEVEMQGRLGVSVAGDYKKPGLQGKYWKIDGVNKLPDLSWASATAFTRVDPQINFHVSKGPTWKREDDEGDMQDIWSKFAVRWTGDIKIKTSGKYQFELSADDGAKLYVDDKMVVDNDGLHDLTKKESEEIELTSGFHAIKIDFFNAEEPAGIYLKYKKEGDSEYDLVPKEMLFHSPDTGEPAANTVVSAAPTTEPTNQTTPAVSVSNDRS